MQERYFKAEIEAARNDPAQLRKIADEIQAAGGSRLLVIRVIQRARAADTGPHPLGKASAELGLPRPPGLSIYRYQLAPGTFERLEKKVASGLYVAWPLPSRSPAFVHWDADWFRLSY